MNPLNWSRNEKIAAALTVAIGVVVGVIVGYFAYAISRGASGARPLWDFLDYPMRFGWIWWALTGAAIAVALIYIRRLTSRPD